MSTDTSAFAEGAIVAKTKVHLEAQHTERPGLYLPGAKLPDDLHQPTLEEFVKYGSAGEGEARGDGPTLSQDQLDGLVALGALQRSYVRLEKYEGSDTEERAADEGEDPDDVIESVGNLLLIGGASALWHRVIGGSTVGAYSNANAQLGVGSSTTAAADTQTNLQDGTPTWKAMDSTYPQHTDSTGTSGSKACTFRSTFGTGDANEAWEEWAIRNADGTPRVLNRKVEALGTKTAGATWVLTVTPALA